MSNTAKKNTPVSNKQDFNADVSRLLDIVANALYTNHDVFLRELISNSSDACDRLRYEAIKKPELIRDNPNFRIHVYKDTDTRTLTVVDNGIGMSKDELIENLGTIAKSGTASLMEQIKSAEEDKNALKLIGQFGVGFYASYMVANTVKVTSRKADSDDIWTWYSDGRTGFEVTPATHDEKATLDGARGTSIVLDIKDEAVEFLIDEQIKLTVEQYSNHIDVKIFMNQPADTEKGEGQPINTASALWMRHHSEITGEEYTAFYKNITYGFDEPLMTSHWRAEGKIEFNALLFLPLMRPWDLYDPSRKSAVKLYVKRVLISEELDGLIFPWMRFMRGVINSEDLPLNISRETLQYNPVVSKIRTTVTKRVLGDLDKLSRNDPSGFLTFWGQFGAALKEGLYDCPEHREAIFKVCRFYSTHEDAEKLTTLDDYVERMRDSQKEIYYISGENADALKNSPQLEGFKARGLEVLFFTDTIDDFWLQNVTDYKEKTFKSVTKGDIDLDSFKTSDQKNNDDNKDYDEKEPSDLIKSLAGKLQTVLSDSVSDVRLSKRLTSSPVCIVAPDSGVDMHMERVLKVHQKYAGESKPVLEINPGHELIEKIGKIGDDDIALFEDAAYLLLDQARVIQGEPLKNTGEFVRRMSAFMSKGL